MRIYQTAVVAIVLGSLLTRATVGQEQQKTAEAQTPNGDAETKVEKKADEKWRKLLPKEGLDGWRPTDFGSDAEVRREGDLLVVEMGDPMNGITYEKKDFPTDNFEIQLEAMRVEGNDFLCGLTFPVGGDKQYCSLIAGGWGGSVTGLSSIDGVDASENSTTDYIEFKNGEWYKFRVRVDPENVTVWVNDEKRFFQEREGHEFSTRIEVWDSQPLGFCAYMSEVHVRNFVWRPVQAEKSSEAKPVAPAAPTEQVK